MAESATGLTEAQAQARLEAGQENTTNLKPLRTLQQARRESIFTVFNLNMVGLAVILLLLSEWIGAGVTLLLLGFSTTIRNVHESLAAKRLDAVRQAVREHARSLEKNKPKEIRGEVLLRDNPRLHADEGWFVADIKVLVNIREIVPYSVF